MFNFKKELVTALLTVDSDVPVYAESELSLDENSIPCITYSQANDVSDIEGGNIRYSNHYYEIKYWCDGASDEQAAITNKIDSTMYALGFKRVNYTELTYGTYISCNMRYQGLGKEYIIGG